MYTVNEIENLIEPIAKRYGVKKVFLFGSYAKGTATENSDLDLLVDSGLKGLRFVGFVEDVRSGVQKDVDIIDTSHIDEGSTIDKEIKKYGRLIYEG